MDASRKWIYLLLSVRISSEPYRNDNQGIRFPNWMNVRKDDYNEKDKKNVISI